MPDPRLRKIERRPDNVPADWLTRQQAEKHLKITPYLLRQYMATLAETYKGQCVDLGKGKAAYLSHAFVHAIETLHKSVESAKDVKGYRNRTEAETTIGCYSTEFGRLVNDNPPDITKGHMRLLRNNNSQIFPYYSDDYVEHLRQIHHASSRAVAGAHAVENQNGHGGLGTATSSTERAASGMTAFLQDEIEEQGQPPVLDSTQVVSDSGVRPKSRERVPKKAALLELTEHERQIAMQRVQAALVDCERVMRYYSGDKTLDNIHRQLQMAAQDLRQGTVIPQGLDRLLSRLERYTTESE